MVFRFINAKINLLRKIRVADAVFIEMKCRWLQTGLADLKKHQTLEILLMTDFFTNFLKSNFLRFLKITSSKCFNHCMCFILSERGRANSAELDQSILRRIILYDACQ